jgi:hypothetical protein
MDFAGDQASTARRCPPQLPPVNEQGCVRSGRNGDDTSMQTRSRERGEWLTATFSLADDLPEGSGSPAKDSPCLHDGEVLQESGERGVSK